MQKEIIKETFYKLDGNLYKVIEDIPYKAFIYKKGKGFTDEVSPYDITLNGNEITKNEALNFIKRNLFKK